MGAVGEFGGGEVEELADAVDVAEGLGFFFAGAPGFAEVDGAHGGVPDAVDVEVVVVSRRPGGVAVRRGPLEMRWSLRMAGPEMRRSSARAGACTRRIRRVESAVDPAGGEG